MVEISSKIYVAKRGRKMLCLLVEFVAKLKADERGEGGGHLLD